MYSSTISSVVYGHIGGDLDCTYSRVHSSLGVILQDSSTPHRVENEGCFVDIFKVPGSSSRQCSGINVGHLNDDSLP